MSTYVSLINWTEQGIKEFRHSVKRAENLRELVAKVGGTVRELLWTIGEYDAVVVVEFPDEESGLAALLQVGSGGHIRTTTLRAFNTREMDAIISKAT
ncbi:MAG: GYD domain-containing protein [Streptosporangiaceae bacterium]